MTGGTVSWMSAVRMTCTSDWTTPYIAKGRNHTRHQMYTTNVTTPARSA